VEVEIAQQTTRILTYTVMCGRILKT